MGIFDFLICSGLRPSPPKRWRLGKITSMSRSTQTDAAERGLPVVGPWSERSRAGARVQRSTSTILTWCLTWVGINGTLLQFLSTWKIHNMRLNYRHCIYGVMQCAPKKFRKLPRAARFCTKRFRGFDFWTYFLCPFLKNFSSLVQIRIEK